MLSVTNFRDLYFDFKVANDETLNGDMMGKKSVPKLRGKIICKIGTIESNTCLISPPKVEEEERKH